MGRSRTWMNKRGYLSTLSMVEMARRLCSNGLPCHRILGAWRMPAKIAVGVITQRRPQQFATLLARLAEQDTPAGAELHFIFVENDHTISVQQSVDHFKSTLDSTGGNVHFGLETKIGIPFARNRVMDIAKALQMDWLAWIDDDDLRRQPKTGFAGSTRDARSKA